MKVFVKNFLNLWKKPSDLHIRHVKSGRKADNHIIYFISIPIIHAICEEEIQVLMHISENFVTEANYTKRLTIVSHFQKSIEMVIAYI